MVFPTAIIGLFGTNVLNTGWWLSKKLDGSQQGWAPSAYLVEDIMKPVPPPAPPVAVRHVPPPPLMTNGITRNGLAPPADTSRAKPKPPAPPTKRPAGGKKPAPPLVPRDSAVSMGNSGGSGRNTPNEGQTNGGSLAGGLAEALRQRQLSMQGKKEDDDDW